MSVITITTVGFTEVNPLTDASKSIYYFTYTFEVSSYGYLVSMLSEYLSNMKLSDTHFSKKSKKKIAQLSGHTIVCGYGRNGQQAYLKLSLILKEIVLLLISFGGCRNFGKQKALYVRGDAKMMKSLSSLVLLRLKI